MAEGRRHSPAWIEVPLRWAVWLSVRAVPPRGRGLRIAAAINRLLAPSGRLFRARPSGGFAISCDLRDPVQACVFYRGVYEPEVVRCLARALRPGDVFVDVGANIGYFTSIAARQVGVSGRVLAFEPAADIAERLREDVRAAGQEAAHVEVHEVALGDSARDGRLVDVAGPNRAGERSLGTHPDDVEGMEVKVVTFDSLLEGGCFDVAKVDVEGAELQVLQGMVKAIRRSHPRLLLVEAIEGNLRRFDACVDDIIGFMEMFGYQPEHLPSEHFAAMIAFTPKPSAELFTARAAHTRS